MKNVMNNKLTALAIAVLGLSLGFSAYSADDVDREARRAEMKAKFDVDGDGIISDRERSAAQEKHRERVLKRFDVDGNGELNGRERHAAKQARDNFRERREDNRHHERRADVASSR